MSQSAVTRTPRQSITQEKPLQHWTDGRIQNSKLEAQESLRGGAPLSAAACRPIIFGMQRIFFRAALVAALFSALPLWSGEIVRMRVEDTIQPASKQYIERVLLEASERGAAVVVMELDTPGGLVDTTRDITSAIMTSPIRRSGLRFQGSFRP